MGCNLCNFRYCNAVAAQPWNCFTLSAYLAGRRPPPRRERPRCARARRAFGRDCNKGRSPTELQRGGEESPSSRCRRQTEIPPAAMSIASPFSSSYESFLLLLSYFCTHYWSIEGTGREGWGVSAIQYTLRRLVIRKVLSTKIWGVPPACLGSR